MSQTALIVASAEAKSEAILDAIPTQQSVLRANTRKIWSVCREMVARRSPICPTASAVAERGAIKDPNFPAERSIYNRYREILSAWRDAYKSIHLLQYEPSLDDGFNSDDLSELDVGLQIKLKALGDELKMLRNMNNSLKQFIAESIRINQEPSINFEELSAELRDWLEYIERRRFLFDDVGLKISKYTVANTIIMDKSLLEKIRGWVGMSNSERLLE